jgi:Ras family protein A
MSGTDLRLLVVGNEGAGKTSLLMVLNGKKFPERYVPLVFGEYTHTEDIRGVSHTLHVVDTVDDSGELSCYDKLHPIPYRGANVILLCFALDGRYTFENLTNRWNSEVRHYCPNAKIILVGLRSDLREPSNSAHVTDDEARAFHTEHEYHAFIACSAKTGEGIDQVFPVAASAYSTRTNGDWFCLLL